MGTVLETSRLRLRELVPSDIDFVADMLTHPDVNVYYERQFTRADAQQWLDRQLERYRRDGHGLWLAVERTTAEPVGQVGLALQDVEGTRCPELGWLLARPYWGRGYATEAGRAVRGAASSRWGYASVIALVRPENEPSRRVAERVGLLPAREVEFHGFKHILYEGHGASLAAESPAAMPVESPTAPGHLPTS
ncbi:MAG: GNAT family N-acetyltransferase [Gemmatimonadetes bacterium]|nr:GNAT family N-acetyltransferase [Gemmatimonadota bacterium]HPE12812.1 GNAT family N-acetyltransferase [Actinomycetota bacterium]